MFNRTVNLEKDKVIVRITCNKRAHINEPKVIFKEAVEDSIPEELKNKVKLVTSPEEILSNMSIPGHSQECTWVFEIVKQQKNSPQRPPARRRRAKINKKTS